MIGEYELGILALSGFYVLLALSCYIISLAGQVSLGQQGFYAIGAYVAGIATALWGWSILPALGLGTVASMVMGVVVGVPALRIKGLYLAIATLAFGEIVRLSLINIYYSQPGIDGKLVGPVGPEGFRHIRYFYSQGWTTAGITGLVLLTVVLILVAMALVDRSRMGAKLRAVGLDETAAAMAGINVAAVKVLAFVAGAAIAGLSGGLYAHYATFVSEESFQITLGVFAASYVIIGGTGNVLGPVAGVAFFMLLTEGLRGMEDYRFVVFGVAIVLIMIIRPYGFVDVGLVRSLRSRWARIRRPSVVAS